MSMLGVSNDEHGWITSQPWRLWVHQLLALVRQEIKGNFFTRRAIWVYLLAFAPVVVIGVYVLHGCPECSDSSLAQVSQFRMDEDTTTLAGLFQFYYLRFGLFFGIMGIFAWLFRGQILQRTLHYHFLAPLRRELLVIGKFVAGVAMASILFGAGVLLSFALTYGHFGSAGYDYVFRGPGLHQLGGYLAVTILACVGYGAVFLTLTIVFKNPIIPGVLWLAWETFSGIFPAVLQRLSVSFYLKHLCPVEAPSDGILALLTVVAEPVAAWASVLGLLLLASAALALACVRIRKLEISYSSEQ